MFPRLGIQFILFFLIAFDIMCVIEYVLRRMYLQLSNVLCIF